MLSRRAHLALLDIRDCILLARDFTAGLSYQAFSQSRLHFFAATRALEIVSEASRRLPDDLLDRHPALPWRAIRDAGNMYRHSYDNVVETIVWKTVQEDLTPLLEVIMAEIQAHEAADGTD
jgi:uncharacterized protein with HEPN domain